MKTLKTRGFSDERLPGYDASVLLADGRTLSYRLFGDPDGRPCFFLHGFPASRLHAAVADEAGRRLGLLVVSPDRPGIGYSSPNAKRTMLDDPPDLAAAADALGFERFGVFGTSGGGPFALAAAVALRERVTTAVLVASLAPPDLVDCTHGMAFGERIGWRVGGRVPGFAGVVLDLVARLARRRPELFVRLMTSQVCDSDRWALRHADTRAIAFADYVEAFRQGSAGVRRELELITRPWGFRPRDVDVPVFLHHGDADATVPVNCGHFLAGEIPGCVARFHPGEGHFSILVNRLDEMLEPLVS